MIDSPSRPSRRVIATRWRAETASRVMDDVAAEEPIEIRVDTRSVAVVMRTPGHDEELAVGFLLTEGVVRRREDVRQVRRNPRNRDGNVIEVFLAADVTVDFARLTRHVFAASSCGLCGKATIAAVRMAFPPAKGSLQVPAGTLLELPSKMREAQTVFGATGGLHAAALFDPTGRLQVLREDVGRPHAGD